MFFRGFLIFFYLSVSFAEVAIEGKTEHINLIQDVYRDVKFEDLPPKAIYKLESKRHRKYADLVIDYDRKVVRFKPKRVGHTTIRFVKRSNPNLIAKQITLTVQKNNLGKIAKEIRNLLIEIEGIEVKVLNNKVIVDGFILLAKDMNRIAMVLSQYPQSQVASLVRLSPLTKKKIADRIEAEIDNPNIYVSVINDFYLLEGTESYAGERERAEKIAQAHISDTLTKFAEKNSAGGSANILPVIKDPNPIINNIYAVRQPDPPAKKMIQVIVHYVELSKSYSRGFSFSWAPSINSSDSSITLEAAPEKKTNILSSLTATITNLLPKLNWAREHGHARILNTMNIIAEEGESGKVGAQRTLERLQTTPQGGVQPRVTKAQIQTSVTSTIDPLKRDSVSMKINVNISEIAEVTSTGSQTVGNSISTKVTVRNKQSAALGGLLRSSSSTGYNRSPANSSEALFKMVAAKEVSRSQSQFVIFATPIIKINASEGMEKVKRKFRLDK